jgi:hypothetical protein
VREETEKKLTETKNNKQSSKGNRMLGRAKGGNPESKHPLLGEEKALPLKAPERIPS